MEKLRDKIKKAKEYFEAFKERINTPTIYTIKYFDLPDDDVTLQISRDDVDIVVDLSKEFTKKTIEKILTISDITQFGNYTTNEVTRDSADIPAKYLNLKSHVGLFDSIVSDCIVNLYKLVIYKKFGFYDWHLCAKNINDCGIIVLNLISRYTDGALEFRDMDGKTMQVFSGCDNMRKVCGVYFPVGISHRSVKVTDGYKVSLLFTVGRKSATTIQTIRPIMSSTIDCAYAIANIDFKLLTSVWVNLPDDIMQLIRKQCEMLGVLICDAATLTEPRHGVQAYKYTHFRTHLSDQDVFEPTANLPINFCVIENYVGETYPFSDYQNKTLGCEQTIATVYYRGFVINPKWRDFATFFVPCS